MARSIMINDDPVWLRQAISSAPQGAGHRPNRDAPPFVKAPKRLVADKVTPLILRSPAGDT